MIQFVIVLLAAVIGAVAGWSICRRLGQREQNLDRKADWLDGKSDEVTKREQNIVEREHELPKIRGELDEWNRLTNLELERVAGVTGEQAKAQLLAQVAEEIRDEAGALARRILEDAKTNAEREARRVITIAVERCASKARTR